VRATGSLERFRRAEAEQVAPLVRTGRRLLEIGAGTGYQAKLFHEWGCDVTAVDVVVRPDAERFWPVQPFDGVHLPFGAAAFDVVFTSNVLEHVADRETLLAEIARVLAPDGCAVHIVPSAAWRIWTSAARYPHAALRVAGRALPRLARGSDRSNGATAGVPASSASRWVDRLFGPPHGEFASSLAEIDQYRESQWRRTFAAAGFDVAQASRNHLFYTGYTLCPWLPLTVRRGLAAILGSACHVFVVRPRTHPGPA